MEFNLYGINVTIDDDIKSEILLYTEYIGYANDARDKFREFYYNSVEATFVAGGSIREASQIYREIANKIIASLTRNGIYGISADDIMSMHRGFKINNVVNELKENINEIERQRNEERKYREIRKESRGRFVGGGFGFNGAVKGMAMAGAANLATGMAHSMVNSIGNIGSALSRNSKLKHLYDSGMCKKLLDAIYLDCMEFYNVQNEIFSDHNFRTFDMQGRRKKADVIFDQLYNGDIPEDAMPGAIAKMIQLFPGENKYYLLAAGLAGGSDGELQRCMEYYGLETDELQEIIDSYDFRDMLFGSYEREIASEKRHKVSYLKEFLYHNFHYGVIDRLSDDESVFSTWLTDSIKKMKEFDETRLAKVEHYVDGTTWNTLAILFFNGIRFNEGEVALFGTQMYSKLMPPAYKLGYFVVTTERIICSSNGACTSYPIMDIYNTAVHDECLCLVLHSQKNVVSLYFEGGYHVACSIEEFLWELILLLQGLHTYNMPNRVLPLFTVPDQAYIDATSKNTVGKFFMPDTAYFAKNFSTVEDLRKLCGAFVEGSGLQFGGYKTLPGETILCELSGGKDGMTLTDKHLYIRTKKGGEEVLDIERVDRMCYDWRSSCYEFFINNNSYKMISVRAKEGKAFVGVFWFLKPLLEYQKTRRQTDTVAIEDKTEPPSTSAKMIAPGSEEEKQRVSEITRPLITKKTMLLFGLKEPLEADKEKIINDFAARTINHFIDVVDRRNDTVEDIIPFFEGSGENGFFPGASSARESAVAFKQASTEEVAGWLMHVFDMSIAGDRVDGPDVDDGHTPEKKEETAEEKKVEEIAEAIGTELPQNTGVKRCPACQKPNKPTARFCSYCGEALDEPRFCTECGAKLRPGKKFCSKCGAKID